MKIGQRVLIIDGTFKGREGVISETFLSKQVRVRVGVMEIIKLPHQLKIIKEGTNDAKANR